MFNRKLMPAVLICTLLLSGCWNQNLAPDSANDQAQSDQNDLGIPDSEPFVPKLTDDRMVYERDSDGVIQLYVTVTPENLKEQPPKRFEILNQITNTIDTEKTVFKAIFQEGDLEGVKAGYFESGQTVANATITTRGRSTMRAPQKSYKIKLMDETGYWREQNNLNLNKHPYDITRFRNKLSFDYFELIPDLTSLRTQFVSLHIKDLTSDVAADRSFKEYGLFTQVEHPNKSFLRTHGLDPNGHLYKANNFEFFRYPEQIKLKSDPGYDKDVFETVLEINGSQDHAKLIDMLEDVNDPSQNFNEVFDRYFDEDNYLTWVAVNILFDNMDTNSQNFLLYSPLNSEKWFFLPWDYDGGWGFSIFDEEEAQELSIWEQGIANYWGTILHQRYFKKPEHIELLIQKMNDLLKIVTEEQTQQFIDQYYPVVKAYISREPDVTKLPGTLAEFEETIKKIPPLPRQQLEDFLVNLEKPMPIYLDNIRVENNQHVFSWDYSYDLQGDRLAYTFELSKSPDFSSVLTSKKLTENHIELDLLPSGTYYWRVTIQDEKGNIMLPFDVYQDVEDRLYFGVREIHIEPSSP
ncbi:CotH kinase family protein [Marinicrinis sediminis]|uniref:CotH kinase family protein n=1 Tax=Marinicrinis sediminis TaxID=1652465 RepID=A0ABW5R811_9BACL